MGGAGAGGLPGRFLSADDLRRASEVWNGEEAGPGSGLGGTDFGDSAVDRRRRLAAGTVLELILVVAMARLEERELVPYNFMMAFSEYRKFVLGASSAAQVDSYGKEVAFHAFQGLVDDGLVRYGGNVFHGTHVQGRAGESGLQEFLQCRLLIEPDDVRAVLRNEQFQRIPTAIKHWGLSGNV